MIGAAGNRKAIQPTTPAGSMRDIQPAAPAGNRRDILVG